MLGFHDNNNAARLEYLHQRVGNLAGHPFLHLRSPRVHVDEPGELGQARDLAALVRYVTNVRVPEEWRQMMLAGREQVDITDKHHLVVTGIEDGGQNVLRMLGQPGELLRVSARNPAGRVPDALTVRVLADREQYLAYRALDPLEVN